MPVADGGRIKGRPPGLDQAELHRQECCLQRPVQWRWQGAGRPRTGQQILHCVDGGARPIQFASEVTQAVVLKADAQRVRTGGGRGFIQGGGEEINAREDLGFAVGQCAHQPRLEGLDACRQVLPQVPQDGFAMACNPVDDAGQLPLILFDAHPVKFAKLGWVPGPDRPQVTAFRLLRLTGQRLPLSQCVADRDKLPFERFVHPGDGVGGPAEKFGEPGGLVPDRERLECALPAERHRQGPVRGRTQVRRGGGRGIGSARGGTAAGRDHQRV